MFIPQEELDKLVDTTPEESLAEHAEGEEETKEEVVEEKVEENKEEVSSSTEDEDVVADKARIPYSRFEKVNERAIRAEERLKILEEQAQKQAEKAISDEDVELPSEWVELYGDSDAAKQAYILQTQFNERLRQETANKILEDIEKKQLEKKQQEEEKFEYIEENLNELAKTLKRDLTDAEESAVLDIQDEFTPKDDDGNYIAPLLSAVKAYEIYTLRNSSAKSSKIEAKKKVLSATGANTDEVGGESTDSAFDNYRPGVSGLWRDKLNQ